MFSFIPARMWAIVAALAVIAAFSAGFRVASDRCAAREAKALKRAQIAFDKQLAKQNDIATDYERSRETARVEYRDREGAIREVFKTIEVPSECAAPDSVRGLLDNAVQSANGSTGQSSATVSGS